MPLEDIVARASETVNRRKINPDSPYGRIAPVAYTFPSIAVAGRLGLQWKNGFFASISMTMKCLVRKLRDAPAHFEVSALALAGRGRGMKLALTVVALVRHRHRGALHTVAPKRSNSMDGLYTEAQAKRGEGLFADRCAPCHDLSLFNHTYYIC